MTKPIRAEEPSMQKVKSHDGTQIAFDQVGSGPPLILVGGAFQYRAFDPRTAELAGKLAKTFTVFNYDRRGRGDSGDTGAYAVEREVEDLAALAAEAGSPALVFGNSSGAALALDAAARQTPITKLAVYEAPFIVDASRPPIPDSYRSDLTALLAAGRRGDAVELFLTAAAGVPAEYLAAMRADASWTGFEAVAHTLPYDAALMDGTVSGKPLPADRWAPVTIPTLVIDGGASPPQMSSAAQALTGLLPNATRRTLSGQAHDVDPALLAAALTEFFTA
jgi:pimeloyl-ACP methyl ester carboxylesterase